MEHNVADLKAKPLTLDDIFCLHERIREADLMDLKCQDASALEALFEGLTSGEAWGIFDDGVIIGAGGFTDQGYVWSMWVDLSLRQSMGIMKKAEGWARVLRMRAGQVPLQNVFVEGNRATETFLKRTRCVDIQEDCPLTYNGRTFIPFFLKPLAELPRHV